MSGSDQGDDKGFLARWSQRKQEARQPEPKPEAPVADARQPPEPVAEKDAAPEFDLSSLPKLEEMTGTTDITGFLRKGVPEHLRNAALRKSWALDPAIRNYVNPALEYAYDWNTPGGVPGSGELGAGMDVARMVSQIMGSGEPAAAPSIPAAESGNAATSPAPAPEHHATRQTEPDLPTETLRLGDEVAAVSSSNVDDGDNETGRTPEAEASNFAAPQQPVRRHGTAKPIV
ncbi:MAG: DUF3306 domain-containing protein [Bradyrhizobium sp.]